MILRNVVDTYVNQKKTSTNYATTTTLAVRDGSGQHVYSLLKASGIPFGDGVVIIEAILELTAAETMPSQTIVAQKATGPWTSSRVTWTKRPPVTGTDSASVTQSAVKGTVFSFDITAIASQWSAGDPNYGVELTTDSTTVRRFFSANASGANAPFKPRLLITFSAPPNVPTGMVPANGQQVSIARPTLSWIYGDPDGAGMGAYQLQTHSSDVWTAPTYDSGTVDSVMPQHVLTSDIADAASRWWRVRNRNTDGRWSDWSDGELFGRTNKSALTIDSPGAPPNDYVSEFTPPHLWTFAGTQIRFELETFVNASGALQQRSGELSGDDQEFTFLRPLDFTAGPLRDELHVWDDVDRAETPGDPAYTVASRVYSLQPSAGVTPVAGLTVTSDGFRPRATVRWTRGTAPDSFTIRRGTKVIAADLLPSDAFVSGTTYEFVDLSPQPNTEAEWFVDAVVDGEISADSPSVLHTVATQYIWLLNPRDPDWWLAIADEDAGTWDMGEQSDMHEIRGSDRLVIISQGLRGYEGSISGGLYSDLPGLEGLTASQLRDRAWALKLAPTDTYRLALSDINIPVVVRKVVPSPTSELELDFNLTFEFYQQGELPWDDV